MNINRRNDNISTHDVFVGRDEEILIAIPYSDFLGMKEIIEENRDAFAEIEFRIANMSDRFLEYDDGADDFEYAVVDDEDEEDY